MEAIGHLTGGIAHDFNNILTAIMGYVLLAMERAEAAGDAKIGMYLDRARQSCQRARDLIQQMLTFSRGQRGEPRPLALAPLIKESVKLLGSTFPSSVEIRTELDASVPAVLLDPVQVEQILMNLCINARDAMEGKGGISITLSGVERRQAVCASCRKTVAGHWVEIAVSDTGRGIPAEVVEHMFEPFYTTKEPGKGSGMGLSSVHGIVHEHSGHIVVETAPGAGTTFRVLLRPLPPATSAAQGDLSGALPSHERPGRDSLHGRVLVVDDEASVAELMQDLLENWGLTVTQSTSSLGARDTFAADPQRFDLVVLDQTMPRMTGLELAQEILRLRPDIPIVLYTGYREALSEQQVKAQGLRALIRKPVDAAELFTLLRSLLPPATSLIESPAG